MENQIIAILTLLFIVIIFLSLNIKIIKQNEQAIVERLGAYYKIIGPGIHFMIPFIERNVFQQSTENLEVDLKIIVNQEQSINVYLSYDIDIKTFYYARYQGEINLFKVHLERDVKSQYARNEDLIKIEHEIADQNALEYLPFGIVIKKVDLSLINNI